MHTVFLWLQASSLSRGLPTLWLHMCIINDALWIIYDAQWCTVRLWQYWSFGRFLKGKNMVWKIFFGSFYYMNDAQWCTVRHCVSFMMHCASLMMHSASLCDHNVGSPLYRGRLQSNNRAINNNVDCNGTVTGVTAPVAVLLQSLVVLLLYQDHHWL